MGIVRWLWAVRFGWLWAVTTASVGAADLDGAVWAEMHGMWLWAATIASRIAAELDAAVSPMAAAAVSLLGLLARGLLCVRAGQLSASLGAAVPNLRPTSHIN